MNTIKAITAAIPNINAKYLSAPVESIAKDPTSNEIEVSIKRICFPLKFNFINLW